MDSMPWHQFLNRIISDGIAAARRDYVGPEHSPRLEGSIAGFEACGGKTISELATLLAESREKVHAGLLRRENEVDTTRYWYLRCYEAEVEWVCNVVSAALMNIGQPTIIPPTARGVSKAAEILGVAGDVESLSV